MTTPNIEELIADLRLNGEFCPEEVIHAAADLLQVQQELLSSQAERITTLEKELGDLPEAQAEMLAEIKQLRAQLAEIKTEPVAWIDEYGNTFPLAARQYSIVGKGWKPLFTRPMPAQDVTELVEALETIIEYNRDHARDQYGDPDKAESWACIVTARTALSKYKGAKV